MTKDQGKVLLSIMHEKSEFPAIKIEVIYTHIQGLNSSKNSLFNSNGQREVQKVI